MGIRWGLRMMIATGLVTMLGFMTVTHGRAADDPPASATESASDIDNVQSRGLTLPKPTLPPPPVQLPSTVPVIDSVRVVTRPTCDTRQLQPYQIAKPCARVTSTSSTSEANMQHKLQFKGKNLLGATVFISNGPNDVRLGVPGALGDPVGCLPGACFEIYMTPHQGTQRGARALQVKNSQGQTTTVQIEVVDGHVINVPPPNPGRTAQPAPPRQLPPCPPPSSTGTTLRQPGSCQ